MSCCHVVCLFSRFINCKNEKNGKYEKKTKNGKKYKKLKNDKKIKPKEEKGEKLKNM